MMGGSGRGNIDDRQELQLLEKFAFHVIFLANLALKYVHACCITMKKSLGNVTL